MSPGAAHPVGLVLGAGAQGRVTAAIWHRFEPRRRLVFLDDDRERWGGEVGGISVEGGLELCQRAPYHQAAGIVAIGHNPRRWRIAEQWRDHVAFVNVVDPSALVMPGAALGRGNLLGPQAVVHTGAEIGDHTVINTAVVVEHDCRIGDGAYLAPGVHMGGRARVGKGAFIATGATLAARVCVGQGAIVGVGAVVVRDVPARMVAFGSPARAVRPAADEDWTKVL